MSITLKFFVFSTGVTRNFLACLSKFSVFIRNWSACFEKASFLYAGSYCIHIRMEIGVLYLSHAVLALAELIVCSTRGFACILAKWFWPTEISLSFTYGSPEASCNKRADTY